MSLPKKWYIDATADGNGYLLNDEDGVVLRKPDATKDMGKIKEVSVGPKEKYKQEGMVFKCENGKIWLSLQSFQMDRTAVSIKFAVMSAEDFVRKWSNLTSSDVSNTLVETSSALLQENRRTTQTSPALLQENRRQTSPVALKENRPPDRNVSEDSSSKRLKFIPDVIDERIEKCKQGTMELPIQQLTPPPRESRLLRTANPDFVENLKNQIKKDPAAPGKTPMVVLCQEVSEFNQRLKNVYSYEVLGGLHTFLAKQKLMAEYPENPYYKTALADVYLGLNDEESLRIAQRHNATTHYIHKVTHRDMVEACRARLYKMAGKKLDEDETPESTAAWRDSCDKAILPEGITKTQRDLIFSQATLHKRVWLLAVKVMDKYEKCDFKYQRQTVTNKPEFKQSYLSPIRNLDEDEQCHLLELALDEKITILGLKEAGLEAKKLISLKAAFKKLVNADDWEQCKELYPEFTTSERLRSFLNINLKKGVPASFKQFCLRAKSTAEGSSEVCDTVVKVDGAVCHVIPTSADIVSFDIIHQCDPDFQGAALSVLKLNEDLSTDAIETICFSMKEVNAREALDVYTVAAICPPDIAHKVQASWNKAFSNVDMLFFSSRNCGPIRSELVAVVCLPMGRNVITIVPDVPTKNVVFDTISSKLNV